MPHAEAYNEALEAAGEVEHLRKRFLELTKQNIGLEQQVEELTAAVEHVNNAGVLRIRGLEARNACARDNFAAARVEIRELEARNAKLEAVYEAVKDMPRLNLFWSVGVRIAMEDAEPAPAEPQEVQNAAVEC